MNSGMILNVDGHLIRWTTDGENYRYVISKGEHLLTIGSGSGHESRIQATKENMDEALGIYLRVSAHVAKESKDG